MKTIVRSHPLKDIILEFDESKEQPLFEKEALEIYDEAHDVVWDLKQRLDWLTQALYEANEEVSKRYEELFSFENNLVFVEDSLGLYKGPILPDLHANLTIDVTGLFKDIKNHSAALQELYELIDELTLRYNQEIERIDPDDEWQEHWPVHGRYFGLFRQLYARYEELSVNIVSLDDDEQNFLEIYGNLFDHYREQLDFAEEVFEWYRRLVELADPLYKRTSEAMMVMDQKMRKDLGNEYLD